MDLKVVYMVGFFELLNNFVWEKLFCFSDFIFQTFECSITIFECFKFRFHNFCVGKKEEGAGCVGTRSLNLCLVLSQWKLPYFESLELAKEVIRKEVGLKFQNSLKRHPLLYVPGRGYFDTSEEGYVCASICRPSEGCLFEIWKSL